MNKFSGSVEGANRPIKKIPFRERTSLDEITDVGWLGGEVKVSAQARYLAQHGQYFDNGVRTTIEDMPK